MIVPALSNGEVLGFTDKDLELMVDIRCPALPVSVVRRLSPSLEPILLCPDAGVVLRREPLMG